MLSLEFRLHGADAGAADGHSPGQGGQECELQLSLPVGVYLGG
jgi:hypothetical protein